MNPKTKLHYKILRLHKKLPKLSKKQYNWGLKHMFSYYALKYHNKTVCFECGHTWYLKSSIADTLLGIECPNCGKTLEKAVSKSWTKCDLKYLNIIDVIEDMQVIRIFRILHYMSKGNKATYQCDEIIQHWIDSNGKHNIMSVDFSGLCNYYIDTQWRTNGGMVLRYNDHPRYHNYIDNYAVYPNTKYIDNLYRNGFNGDFHGYDEAYFIKKLLTNKYFETLLKKCQYSILKSYTDYKKEEYWNQIRLCIRNNYIVNDASMWYDYIEFLKYFRMNITDSKLVCPEDLYKEHDILMRRKEAIEDRRRTIAEQERRMKEERETKECSIYKKLKTKLKDMSFSGDGISIVALTTANKIKKEGLALDHCVYTSGYHKKPFSFIMSARKDNTSLETIEIDLMNYRVVQVRGHHNEDSDYHSQIINILKVNLPVIKQKFENEKRRLLKLKI